MKIKFNTYADKSIFFSDVKRILKYNKESISFISSELRTAGWKRVSHLGDLEDTLEDMGFKIHKNYNGCNVISTYVTME